MSCLLIPHDLHSLAILPLHLKDQTPLSVFTGCFWYVKTCLVVSQTDGITFMAAVEWAWSQVRCLLLGLQLVVLVLGAQVNVVFIWSMGRWNCLQYLGLWGSRRLRCLLQDLQLAGLLPGVYVGMAPTVSLGRLLRWHWVVAQVGMIGPNCNLEGLELSQGLLHGPWLEQIYRPVLRGTDRCASCQICG